MPSWRRRQQQQQPPHCSASLRRGEPDVLPAGVSRHTAPSRSCCFTVAKDLSHSDPWEPPVTIYIKQIESKLCLKATEKNSGCFFCLLQELHLSLKSWFFPLTKTHSPVFLKLEHGFTRVRTARLHPSLQWLFRWARCSWCDPSFSLEKGLFLYKTPVQLGELHVAMTLRMQRC